MGDATNAGSSKPKSRRTHSQPTQLADLTHVTVASSPGGTTVSGPSSAVADVPAPINPEWNRAAFEDLMKAAGRPVNLIKGSHKLYKKIFNSLKLHSYAKLHQALNWNDANLNNNNIIISILEQNGSEFFVIFIL